MKPPPRAPPPQARQRETLTALKIKGSTLCINRGLFYQAVVRARTNAPPMEKYASRLRLKLVDPTNEFRSYVRSRDIYIYATRAWILRGILLGNRLSRGARSIFI